MNLRGLLNCCGAVALIILASDDVATHHFANAVFDGVIAAFNIWIAIPWRRA